MALEIERRFLVEYKYLYSFSLLEKLALGQAYLSKPGDSSVVRVRFDATNTLGYVTIKKQVVPGVNEEYEFSIPYEEAYNMVMANKETSITKLRYIYPLGHLKFEIDYFDDKSLGGIIIAEIELPSLDYYFDKPSFLGREITGVKELSNFSMAFEPEKAKETFNSLKY